MSGTSRAGGHRTRQERVFTVRVWREAGGRLGHALRGSVVEVGSGQRFLFSTLADLSDFLQLRLADEERSESDRS
jgi:hypothetical protein